MGFGNHVGGFVGGRAVDADADLHAGRFLLRHGGDAAAEAAVALRAVGDAGARLAEDVDLLRVELDEVGEPDVGAGPAVVGAKAHGAHAVHALHGVLVADGLGEMGMQADAHLARGLGEADQFLGRDRIRRRGRRHDHAAHGVGRGIVEARHVFFDAGEELLVALGLERLGQALLEVAGLGLAAAAEHEAQAELVGLVEEDGAAVEGHVGVVDVVVVGDGARARAHEFDQADARGEPEHVSVHVLAEAVGRGGEPGGERQVDAGGGVLEQALEEMVVGVDPGRIDDAAAAVDDLFARLGLELADLGDQAVDDADVGAGMTALLLGEPGENRMGVAQES